MLKKKLSIIAFPIYRLFKFLEKKQLNQADKIVIIYLMILEIHYLNGPLMKIIFFIYLQLGKFKNFNYYEHKKLNFLKDNDLETDKFYISYTGYVSNET